MIDDLYDLIGGRQTVWAATEAFYRRVYADDTLSPFFETTDIAQLCSRQSMTPPEKRILPQLLVIVQVFVTQRQPVDPLRQHLFQALLDPLRLPVIREAASNAPQQSQLAISLAQQQRTTLGGQPAALELSHDLARKMSFKRKESLATLCH